MLGGKDETVLRLPVMATASSRSNSKNASDSRHVRRRMRKKHLSNLPPPLDLDADIAAGAPPKAMQRRRRNDNGRHCSRRTGGEEAQFERHKESVTSHATHRFRRTPDDEPKLDPGKAAKKFESLPVLFQQIAYLHGVTEVSHEAEQSSVPKLPALQSVPMDRASAKLVIRSVLQDRLQFMQHSSSSGPLTAWKPTSSNANTLPSQDKYLLPPSEVLQGQGSPKSPTIANRQKRSRKKEQHKNDKVLIPQDMVDHTIKLVKRTSCPHARPADSICRPTTEDTEQKRSATTKVRHQERELTEHEKCCIAAFHRYQEDGEIHRDCMIQALRFVGFSDPDPSWVHELCDALTTCSTFNQEEFLRLNDKYEERRNEASKILFSEYDPYGTGKVDVSKLRDMLANFGISPMGYVLRSILKEVQKRHSSKGTAEFTFRQFGWIMDALRDQENFSSEELAHFWNAFDRFDSKKTGVILATDLQAVLRWLCYILPVSAMDAIRDDVGGSSPGALNKREFLVYLRKVREHEHSCIQHVLEVHRGKEPIKLLQTVLDTLAFNPEPCDILVRVEELGLFQKANKEIDADIVGEFLEVYRRSECFATSEADELFNWFSEFDVDGRGHVNSLQVAGMLRQMGLPVSRHVARKLAAIVDVNGSGELDMSDFLKLLRSHREHEDQRARLTFQRMAGSDCPFRVLRAGQVEEALFELGLPKLPADMREGFACNLMLCASFVRLARSLRTRCRSIVRSNFGFSHTEVEQLRSEFQSYDRHVNGNVVSREMHKFIEKHRPGTVSSAALRTQLIALMEIADKEQSGSVCFPAFLHLARRCFDMREEEELLVELTSVHETEFSFREVAEFRELFLGEHDRTSISLVEVRQMFAKVMPMGHKNSHELSAAFTEIIPEKDGGRTASFPQFLRLMRRVLDMNLGNIKDHASTVVLS